MDIPVFEENIEPRTLYVVATPIGNLADITLRALYILKNVDLIACEDTRRTALLLQYYGIEKPLISFHSHSGKKRFTEIRDRLETETIALVSDAGSPCVSDPGAELVAYLIQNGFSIRPIPGPSAAISALSASGLDTREFTFRGFLGKKGLRQRVKEILKCPETQIVYESPQRLVNLLRLICEIDPNRDVVVAREVTKLYEEFIRKTAKECLEYFADKEVKGEITLLIAGEQKKAVYTEEGVAKLLKERFDQGQSLRDATKELAKELGIPKNSIYEIGLNITRQ